MMCSPLWLTALLGDGVTEAPNGLQRWVMGTIHHMNALDLLPTFTEPILKIPILSMLFLPALFYSPTTALNTALCLPKLLQKSGFLATQLPS